MAFVAVVVGHNQKSQGAVIPGSEISEYTYWTAWSRIFSEALDAHFDNHVFFRDALDIAGTYREISQIKPDYAIELHFNSFSDPSVYGTETLCHASSLRFANYIQGSLSRLLERDVRGDRGVKMLKKGDRGWASVSALKCPSVLIEPFFGSNLKDVERFTQRARIIAEGLSKSLFLWDRADQKPPLGIQRN